MADIERGRQVSTRWWWPVVAAVALLLGILLGLVIPHPYRWQRADSLQISNHAVASAGPAAPFVLSDWEYPQAKALSKGEGGFTKVTQSGVPIAGTFAPDLYAYSTPDALEKVWGHYAKLSGIADKEFKPGGSSSGATFVIGDRPASGAASGEMSVLYYMGDRDRLSVRSATIVTQRPAYTVAVFLSRGKDEERTHISIVVEKKFSPPAS